MPLDFQTIARQRPQNAIHYHAVLDSTMTEAGRLAASNAPHGTVVVADEQTAGIGRLGRHWISEKETGLYCSIVLRVPIAAAVVPVLTLALGLATAVAIGSAAGLDCDLRWPNDVLLKERKVAGILAQLQGDCIVAGIGININQPALPDDLRTPATSLFLATGRTFQREPILIALLEQVDDVCSLLVNQGPEGIVRAFTASSSYVVHRRVVFEKDNGVERGVTEGLNENGFLRVRDDSGIIHTLYTGSVRPDFLR